MKVFNLKFYKVPYIYLNQDRISDPDLIERYLIDSVKNYNLFSYDFLDPINPSISLNYEIVESQSHTKFPQELDINYMKVEYGNSKENAYNHYFFATRVQRLSFGSFRYNLKLDVIANFFNMFLDYAVSKNMKAIFKRRHLNPYSKSTTNENKVNHTFRLGNISYEFSNSEIVGMPLYLNVEQPQYSKREMVLIEFFSGMITSDYSPDKSEFNSSERKLFWVEAIHELTKFYGDRVVRSSYMTETPSGWGDVIFTYKGEKRKHRYILKEVDQTPIEITVPMNSFDVKKKFIEYFETAYRGRDHNTMIDENTIFLTPEWLQALRFGIINAYTEVEVLNIGYTHLPRDWAGDLEQLLTIKRIASLTYTTDVIKFPVLEKYQKDNALSSSENLIAQTSGIVDVNFEFSYRFSELNKHLRENKNQIDNARKIANANLEAERSAASAALASVNEKAVTSLITGAMVAFGVIASPFTAGMSLGMAGLAAGLGTFALSGGFSGFYQAQAANERVKVAQGERQAIEEQLKDIGNYKDQYVNTNINYTAQFFLGRPTGIVIKFVKPPKQALLKLGDYFNRYGSVVNSLFSWETVKNEWCPRYWWQYYQTDDLLKYLDNFFPEDIKVEFAAILDGGVRLHKRIRSDNTLALNYQNIQENFNTPKDFKLDLF